MNDILINALIFAYACTGVIGVIGYIPTIKDLIHHKKMSANISSYVIWTGTYTVGLLYGIFILKNTLFNIITSIYIICCLIIVFMGIALAKKNKK